MTQYLDNLHERNAIIVGILALVILSAIRTEPPNAAPLRKTATGDNSSWSAWYDAVAVETGNRGSAPLSPDRPLVVARDNPPIVGNVELRGYVAPVHRRDSEHLRYDSHLQDRLCG